MLSVGDANRGALIRGIDPALEDTVADIGTHMRARRARRPDARRASASCSARELARALGVRVGDTRRRDHAAGHGHARRHAAAPQELHGVGIFEVGMYEFDSGLALVNIEDAQTPLPAGRRRPACA